MAKSLLTCFIALWAMFSTNALNGQSAVIKSSIRYAVIDRLGQVYISDSLRQISKYDNNGVFKGKFSEYRLGNPSFTDVTNPFNILLFYKEYQQVVFLDRNLNKISEYNLSDLGFSFINAICASNDNKVWVMDEYNAQLKKIDDQGKSIVESADLRMLLGKTITPQFMIERNNRVYLYDRDNGIFIFDNFGQYIQHIDLVNITGLQVIDGNIFYNQNGGLKMYSPLDFQVSDIKLPPTGVIQEDIRYLIEKNTLVIYSTSQAAIFPFNLK